MLSIARRSARHPAARVYLTSIEIGFDFRCVRRLWYVNTQYAVATLGANVAAVHVLGRREGAREAAIEALDPNFVLAALRLLVFTLSFDRQYAISRVIFTSSFFTAGRSALTRYSWSVSLMSAAGLHSDNSRLGQLAALQRSTREERRIAAKHLFHFPEG